MRPLHESVAKEKWAKILLIEAGNEGDAPQSGAKPLVENTYSGSK